VRFWSNTYRLDEVTKKYWPWYQFFMPKRRIPGVFSQIYFLPFLQAFFIELFTVFYAQDLPNKKNCSSLHPLGPRYSSDNLPSFDKRVSYFLHLLYLIILYTRLGFSNNYFGFDAMYNPRKSISGETQIYNFGNYLII
jgi:hypothetical protein